uniref:EF-hand domain-containing protein n=1 Tax=Heterorhabditis bacteriophora TaxID=37862 RepID=A0A1I7XA77_HETBA
MKTLILLTTGFLQCFTHQQIKVENIAFQNEDLLEGRLLVHQARTRLQEIQNDYTDISSEDALSKSKRDNIKTTGISIPLIGGDILPQKQHFPLRLYSTLESPPVLRALRTFRVERTLAFPGDARWMRPSSHNLITKKPQAANISNEKPKKSYSQSLANSTASNYKELQNHMKNVPIITYLFQLRNNYSKLKSMWEQKLLKIHMLNDEVGAIRMNGEKNIEDVKKLTNATHRSPGNALTSSSRFEDGSISVDPRFLDLDDVQKFNDISLDNFDNKFNNKTPKRILNTVPQMTSTLPTRNGALRTTSSSLTKSTTRGKERNTKIFDAYTTMAKTTKLLNSSTTISPRIQVTTIKYARSSTTPFPIKSTSFNNTKHLSTTTSSSRVDIPGLPISKGQDIYKQISIHKQKPAERLKQHEPVVINKNSEIFTTTPLDINNRKLIDSHSNTLPPIVLDFTTESTTTYRTTLKRSINQITTTTTKSLYTNKSSISKIHNILVTLAANLNMKELSQSLREDFYSNFDVDLDGPSNDEVLMRFTNNEI